MRTAYSFILVAVVGAAFAVFTFTFVRAFFYAPDEAIEVPQELHEQSSPAIYPERLVIPSINIDASVQHVGVTAQGTMATPTNFKDVAWYQYGTAPGARGSAVIAGHVDNGLGLAGVFKNLGDLEAGDEIRVRRADGSEALFVVTGKRSYPHNDVPVEVLFNTAGSPRLNLITCEGTWLDEDKTYDQRLVVFAELVG